MIDVHRFFVPSGCIAEGRVRIEGRDARQICTVLRLGPGDRIAALDGTGRALIVKITAASTTAVVGDVIQTCPLDTEPRVKLTLAQSLPKADKLELVVQKGTELGVARFEVFTSARTIARPPKERLTQRFERWRAIAKEAAELACREVIPEVTGIASLEEFLPAVAGYDLALCLWEGENNTSIKEALRQNPSVESILIIVGPEGGFEEEEVRKIREAGATTVSLGPRIVRCETAAIAAAAIVVYEMSEAESANA